MAKQYRYIGKGLGVAGLPHEITDEQAKADQVFDLLMQAMESGLYEEVTPTRGKQKVDAVDSAPDGPAERDIKE